MRTLIAALLLIASSGAAVAAPILIESDGELTGASGVDVGGVLYDVAFVDGTCIGLFDGCDEVGDFDFTMQADAIQASHALLDQVLVNTASGAYDDAAHLTAGCEAGFGLCVVLTPFPLGDGPSVAWSGALNTSAGTSLSDAVAPAGTTPDFDTGTDPELAGGVVYADWSRTVTVPEPGTLLLFGFGLLALGATAVRRRV